MKVTSTPRIPVCVCVCVCVVLYLYEAAWIKESTLHNESMMVSTDVPVANSLHACGVWIRALASGFSGRYKRSGNCVVWPHSTDKQTQRDHITTD